MAKQRRRRAPSRTAVKGRPKPPLEYSLLYTATLCLLALGAVMVYSASSAESLLTTGDSSFFLKRYLIFAALGLAAMHFLSRHGLKGVKNLTPLVLFGSLGLVVAVMLPGIGITVNGAKRWLGAGPVQFQPSELLKLALVLYSAQLLATQPRRMRSLKTLAQPLLGVIGVACLLLLGESVQKIFYLPEAHTDMILAIIGEELGIFGISAVAALYGMIAYAGLRAAKRARDRYAKLLAVGVTSMILCQATLNFFAVMGLAPLTGVPLPFISYGNSNLVVLLGAMGLVLGIARRSGAVQSRGLKSIDGGRSKDERAAARTDRSRRHGGPRRARTRR